MSINSIESQPRDSSASFQHEPLLQQLVQWPFKAWLGQRLPSSRFHLLRYFSLTSFSVFLGLTLGMSAVYERHAFMVLQRSTEDKNIATARLVGNAVWDDFGPFLQHSAELTPIELRRSRKIRRLRLQVLNQTKGLPITAVEIYGTQGRVVFATNTNRMGQSELTRPEIIQSLQGQVSSTLVLDGVLDGDLEGHATTRWRFLPLTPAPCTQCDNRLTSYVPLTTNDSNQVQGVIKVQTDVTPLIAQIHATQRSILLSSAGVSALAYGVLFLLIQRADQLLQRQRRALSCAYEESEQKASDLSQALRQLKSTQAQLVQTEKMSSLGQLVAGVAHEINNPVNFIHGNLKHIGRYTNELLALLELYQREQTPPSPEIQALIEEIDLEFMVDDFAKLQSSMQLGTTRIQNIVKSLRTFSRLDEADMKLVDLHAGLDSTLVILNSQLQAQGKPSIQIIRNYGDLPSILCHASQINQVFMNILANAIDALHESDAFHGKDALHESDALHNDALHHYEMQMLPLIIITTAYRSDEVEVSIRDNGPGIPESSLSTIFDPFFTTKPVGKGTGLGLSISYGIIESHNGKLLCKSDVTRGTEFTITLPLNAPGAAVNSNEPPT